MFLYYKAFLKLGKIFLYQEVRNTLYFLFICLSAPNAFSMIEEWNKEGKPVRYLLIKSGQSPKEFYVTKDQITKDQKDESEEITRQIMDSSENAETSKFIKETDPWHLQTQENFWLVSSTKLLSGQTLGDTIPTNAAQIKIVAKYEINSKLEEQSLILPHVFLSGGFFDTKNKPLLRLLVDEFGPGRARFMDDVVQSEKTSTEKGKEYRENMIDLFRLKSIAKESLGEGEAPISKHTDNSFDIISNLRTLKYLKQPADIMFEGSNFIYEFYDSEQVAREFMNHSVKILLEDYSSQKDDTRLSALEGADENLKSLFYPSKSAVFEKFDKENIATNTALRSELRSQMKFYEDSKVDFGKLFPKFEVKNGDFQAMSNLLIEKLRNLKQLQIQIASHGDMCHSCQGTYWYELETSHNLERNFFRAITQKASQILETLYPESVSENSKKRPPKAQIHSADVKILNPISDLIGKINKSEDPRTQFFPDCEVSVLVSSTRGKPKENRHYVSLSALLTEKTRSPAPENWWDLKH